jgi:signal transduction histidine kinase
MIDRAGSESLLEGTETARSTSPAKRLATALWSSSAAAERRSVASVSRGHTTHAYEQMWVWWIAMFAFAALVVAGAFLFDGDLSVLQQTIGLSALAVLGVAYWRIGFPAMRDDDDRRSALYLLIAFSILALLLTMHPAAFTLLFGLFPQCYSGFTRTRYGATAGLILSTITGVGSFGWAGWDTSELPNIVLQMAFTIGFGLLFGIWITRIIHQSSYRAELIQELERTRSELAEVNRSAGIQSERERLAAEIHDTLAQGFTSIVLLATAAQAKSTSPVPELISIEATARENLAESRALVAALQPVPLQNSSMQAAIGRLVERFGIECDVATSFEIVGTPTPCAPNLEVAFVRIAQEALTNARKHSDASLVAVTLSFDENIELVVHDDGVGFDPSVSSSGFGLDGLRRRLMQLGGELGIDTSPGSGTVLHASAPRA